MPEGFDTEIEETWLLAMTSEVRFIPIKKI